MGKRMVKVLFVCLGNICRSPTAHGVFAQLVQMRGLEHKIYIESAGTGGWHVGEAPDRRAQQAAKARGYDLSRLRAQQVEPGDFERFDYILAMDHQNLRDLKAMCPVDYEGMLELFLQFSEADVQEVPDPYYGGADGFSQVLDLVESASKGLLKHILDRA